MTKAMKISHAAAAIAALTMSACSTTPAQTPQYSHYVSERFPIDVQPSMKTLRLSYARQDAPLDPNMRSQLEAFVSDFRGHGVGALSISAPPNWQGTSERLADQVVAMGVAPTRIIVGTDAQPQSGSEVTLTFIRYIAESAPCGDWSEDLAKTYHNRPMPNLGCATQHNIAAMLSDPRDLLAPKPMGPGDVQRAMTILEKYRRGEPTEAERSRDQSGAVSQVAGGGQ